jgi:predicted metal-dependent HD superfamily phosphohydrolase
MLKKTFLDLVMPYNSAAAGMILWKDLEQRYSEKHRHYHTLHHLAQMLGQLHPVKPEFADWDAALFSLFFHDAVYSASQRDNEEQSAVLAAGCLVKIGLPPEKIKHIQQQILATKLHEFAAHPDTNFFTDADLSVLGTDWLSYCDYTRQIRKEYSLYPDLLYKPGRKKVLLHFLAMPVLFKTPFFFNAFELQARENIKRELEELR